MQVEVDGICMCAKFGEHGLFSFGDFAPFCCPLILPNFPFEPGLQSMGSKNKKICSKFMLIEYACAPSLVGLASLLSEILLFFAFLQISLSDYGLLSMGQKIHSSNV